MHGEIDMLGNMHDETHDAMHDDVHYGMYNGMQFVNPRQVKILQNIYT